MIIFKLTKFSEIAKNAISQKSNLMGITRYDIIMLFYV